MGSRSLVTVAVTAALLGAACGKTRRHRIVLPSAPAILMEEEGVASWYGHPYHGRASASGEIYDMEKLTAAHRTLPFGTEVRVVNLTNNRSVDVRINDRGPFAEGRIIDLSHAAARAIGMIGPGTAPVHLHVLSTPAAPEAGYFAIQTGAFRVRANADRQRAAMEQRYGSARLLLRPGQPDLWRVLVGRETSLEGANALAERLKSEVGHGFVVRVDSPEAN